MGVVDRLAADLGAQTSLEWNAAFTAIQRVHPAAHPPTRLEHNDVPSRVAQTKRRAETGQASPDHNDPPRRTRIGSRSGAHNRPAGLRTAGRHDGHRRTRKETPT
jgi:hypothetical protein